MRAVRSGGDECEPSQNEGVAFALLCQRAAMSPSCRDFGGVETKICRAGEHRDAGLYNRGRREGMTKRRTSLGKRRAAGASERVPCTWPVPLLPSAKMGASIVLLPAASSRRRTPATRDWATLQSVVVGQSLGSRGGDGTYAQERLLEDRALTVQPVRGPHQDLHGS